MNRVAGYIRVSTSEQAQSGLGLQHQETTIRAYCDMRGLSLACIYQDDGVSGSKGLGDRPAGSRLLAALRARRDPLEGVVALKLDRLFRNTMDALASIRDWDRAGKALHLVDLGGASLDTRSATGGFFLTVIAALGELERNLVRERTKGALAVKRSRGERVSRFAPYGYRFSGSCIVPDPREQPILARMRVLRAEGLSYQRIADTLGSEGHQNRLGRPWSWKRVRTILRTSARQAQL